MRDLIFQFYFIFSLFFSPLANQVEGEVLTLSKVTRSEMGAYMCIVSNGVPPSVSKRIKVVVHCKFNVVHFFIVLSLFSYYMEFSIQNHNNDKTLVRLAGLIKI